MPHGGTGWTGVRLHGLRQTAIQLSLLRQSALPQVPWPANRAMAATAAWPFIALPLLPADLHVAFGAARPGPLPSKAALRLAAQYGSRKYPEALRRPQMAGCPSRLDGGASHLDPSHALSSSRSLFSQRGGLIDRWPALGGGQASQVPGARARSFGNFSSQDARAAQARRAFASSPGKSLETKMGCACAARRQRPKSARLPWPLRVPHRH